MFQERVGLVASHRAFSLGQRLVWGTVHKLADILGALALLKEVSYQWEPRDIAPHGGRSVKFIWEGI